MTTAQHISTMFDNDGGNCQDDSGEWIDDVCAEHATHRYTRGDDTVYVFPLGSMIVTCGNGWDIITTDGERWIDSNDETWADLDDSGEPIGWQVRK